MEDDIVTLTETIPPFSLGYNTTANVWGLNFSDNIGRGWVSVSDLPGGGGITQNKIWTYQSSIDVSGWGNQGLTFYPLSAGVQEGFFFTYIQTDLLQVIDIITDSPLDVGNFARENLLQLPFRTVPSLYQDTPSDTTRLNAPLGFENVIYGMSRNLAYNQNLPSAGGTSYAMTVNSNDFGSMDPTATDKLYITRILVCDNATQTGGNMNCPPARFILKGKLMRESDLSYVYRLKDSFKTSQTDVGYGV